MEQDEATVNFVMPYSQAEHLQTFSQPDILYLSIVEGNECIGFIILALDSDGVSVEFRRIVVSTKGRGYGQKAIALMEDYCKTVLGRSRIWLDVFDRNLRGIYIYEKFGYRYFKNEEKDSGTLLFYEKSF